MVYSFEWSHRASKDESAFLQPIESDDEESVWVNDKLDRNVFDHHGPDGVVTNTTIWTKSSDESVSLKEFAKLIGTSAFVHKAGEHHWQAEVYVHSKPVNSLGMKRFWLAPYIQSFIAPKTESRWTTWHYDQWCSILRTLLLSENEISRLYMSTGRGVAAGKKFVRDNMWQYQLSSHRSWANATHVSVSLDGARVDNDELVNFACYSQTLEVGNWAPPQVHSWNNSMKTDTEYSQTFFVVPEWGHVCAPPPRPRLERWCVFEGWLPNGATSIDKSLAEFGAEIHVKRCSEISATSSRVRACQ